MGGMQLLRGLGVGWESNYNFSNNYYIPHYTMNQQLVNSPVQVIEALSPEERTLLGQLRQYQYDVRRMLTR